MREEEEAPPPEPGLGDRVRGWLSQVGQVLASLLIGIVDAVISPLQRLRSRIAPPVEEEEDPRGRGRQAPTRARAAAEVPAVPAAAKPNHFRNFLFMVLALTIGGLFGMTFSYLLLSKTLGDDAAIIDYMQDEIRNLEKAEKRNLNARAKLQEQTDESVREAKESRAQIRDYQDQVEAYKGQIDNLNRQLNALNDAGRRYSSSQPGRSSFGATPGRPASPAAEKTGNCVTGGGHTAADLARCVDDFNRK